MKIIYLCLGLILFLPSLGLTGTDNGTFQQSKDIVGVVVEGGGGVYQVDDYFFKLTGYVYIDDGSAGLHKGRLTDIGVGSVVNAVLTGKVKGVWQAKQITVFTSNKLNQYLDSLSNDEANVIRSTLINQDDAGLAGKTSDSKPQPVQGSDHILLEQGVYKN